MKRREFLINLGKILGVNLLLAIQGCSGFPQKASLRGAPVEKSMKNKPAAGIPQEKPEADAEETGGFPDLAVIKGEDPEQNVRKAIEAIGGIGRFIKSGNRVAVKPNLLTAAAPEYAVTTNPFVLGAVVKMCYEAGASEVTVFDNSTSNIDAALRESGIAEAAEKAGGKVKILSDRNYENTLIPEGKILTEWPLVKDVFEADVFINLPIAKTHSLARLTLSMKNLMGIMGGNRGLMHLDFDQKIVDLNTIVKPHLIVLDAYRILLRNGPTGGDLADVKLAKTVVAGTNQVTVDAFGATLFGMEPGELAYLSIAKEQGLGETDLSKVKIFEGTA